MPVASSTGKAYETSGGLHGVGVSVVNALSDQLEVEVARNRKLYRQRFSRGKPTGLSCRSLGDVHNRRGTKVRFHPDPEIFGTRRAFRTGPSLPHGALQGLSVRRRRNPLELRSQR
jgi:topoisomerase-4 subunit B